jgi:dipeptidyl aminopeptidase/acylaminoacyl peptidase
MFAAAVLSACAAALFAAAGVAYATFPGENGRMALTKGVRSTGFVDEIYATNPDGSGLERLTHNSAYDYDPAWSPDGKRVAFSSNRGPAEGSAATEVFVMNADGSRVRRVTEAPGDNWDPTWSPSGARIAFQTNRNVTDEDPINTDIYSVRIDGTGEKRLTSNTSSDLQPDWSADGTRIAFGGRRIVGFDEDSNEPVFGGGIYSINPNGGREKRGQGTGAFGGTQGLDWQSLP